MVYTPKCRQLDTEFENGRLHLVKEALQNLYKTSSTASTDVYGWCKASFKDIWAEKMKVRQRKLEARLKSTILFVLKKFVWYADYFLSLRKVRWVRQGF